MSKILECQLSTNLTKEKFLSTMHEVDLLHVATHAFKEDGEISNYTQNCVLPGYMLLTDKVLATSDLKEVKVPLFVVLSCCYSGSGKLCADGLIGMTRGFIACGSSIVVSAHYAVDEPIPCTCELMTDFYTFMLEGLNPYKLCARLN
ncbi:MAG: CHAT domain-containing protein [Candidatus Bathyarchaeia archaeon]